MCSFHIIFLKSSCFPGPALSANVFSLVERSRCWYHPQPGILVEQVIRSAGCYLYQNQNGCFLYFSGKWQSSLGWEQATMTDHFVQYQHVKLTNRGPQIYVEHTFLPRSSFVWSSFTNGWVGWRLSFKAHNFLWISWLQQWALGWLLIVEVSPEVWMPL